MSLQINLYLVQVQLLSLEVLLLPDNISLYIITSYYGRIKEWE